jgi:hypothetical protein
MEQDGDVPEGSVFQRNFLALDARNKQFVEELEKLESRLRIAENKLLMQETRNVQFQQMFATQMVDRGSGPTSV